MSNPDRLAPETLRSDPNIQGQGVSVRGGTFTNSANSSQNLNVNLTVPTQILHKVPETNQHCAEYPSQIYTRLMLSAGRGFPLWDPRPPNRLPPEYKAEGVRIGDVGIIRTDGYFDYLFNICHSACHPINARGIPDGFVPIESTNLEELTDDDRLDGGAYEVEGSVEIMECAIDSQDVKYHLQTGAGEGAALVLPKETLKKRLVSTKNFKLYAGRNAVYWYQFANNNLGLEAPNGSIYLITGWEKTSTWGTASIKPHRSAFCLSFEGQRWDKVGLARCRSYTPNVQSTNDPIPKNQCIFLTGFKMALGERFWDGILGTVRVQDVGRTTIQDIMHESPSIPFIDHQILAWLYATLLGSSPPHDSESEVTMEPIMNDFALEELHPSTHINRYLLRKVPRARVAVTHDDEWELVLQAINRRISAMDVKERTCLEKKDIAALFVEQINAHYDIMLANGIVYFDNWSAITRQSPETLTDHLTTENFSEYLDEQPKRIDLKHEVGSTQTRGVTLNSSLNSSNNAPGSLRCQSTHAHREGATTTTTGNNIVANLAVEPRESESTTAIFSKAPELGPTLQPTTQPSPSPSLPKDPTDIFESTEVDGCFSKSLYTMEGVAATSSLSPTAPPGERERPVPALPTPLPLEVVSQILSFLPFLEFSRASLVSRTWRSIIESFDSNPVLWEVHLKNARLWFGGGSEGAFAESIYARRRHLDRARLTAIGRNSSAPPFAAPSSAAPPLSLPHPHKMLFKSRHLTRSRWVTNPTPHHISFPAHGSSVVTCLLFSHGRIISASDDHSIRIYSPITGELMRILKGHEGGVWALAAAKDTLVSGSTDCTARIWDLEAGRCTHVFGGHESTVRSLSIVKPELIDVVQENGVVTKEKWPKRPLVVTGSRDHSLRVWTLPRPTEPEFHGPEDDQADLCGIADENPYHRLHLVGHDHAVRALAARGRTLVSGSYDCTVRVWDTVTGTCSWVFVGHTQKVYSVVLDTNRDQACSGSMDGTVRVWDLKQGICKHTLIGHTSLVGLLGVSPSHLVSAAADSTLRVWDPDTGMLRHTLAAHTGAITCFQHDEFKVLSGSDGNLKMWDIRDGTVVRDLLTGITGVWQVVFEGRWCVAASNRGDATVLDVWDFGTDSDGEWVGESPNGIYDDDCFSEAEDEEEDELGTPRIRTMFNMDGDSPDQLAA